MSTKSAKKTILNIHGYNGSPENAACLALRELGCRVCSPALDYDRETPDGVLEKLRNTAKENNIGLIAGTSLGGFFGAVLAAELDMPAVLVNPALLPFLHLPRLGFKGDIRPFIRLFGTLEKLDAEKVNCIVGGSDEIIDTHDFAETLLGLGRVRIVTEGRHSGSTLPLYEYFGEILGKEYRIGD